MRVHSYVVLHDVGFAPNPFHGWCTLATCKPDIRRTAAPGDWVLGTGSVGKRLEGRLVYAMHVDERLRFEEYWHDPRFVKKRPDRYGSVRNAYGDNVYHRAPNGTWAQEDCRHSLPDGTTNPGHVDHDTAADAVLLGRDFVYYGGRGPLVPDRLRTEYGVDLVHQGRGRRCRFPEPMVEDVFGWLRTLDRGLQADPADW